MAGPEEAVASSKWLWEVGTDGGCESADSTGDEPFEPFEPEESGECGGEMFRPNVGGERGHGSAMAKPPKVGDRRPAVRGEQERKWAEKKNHTKHDVHVYVSVHVCVRMCICVAVAVAVFVHPHVCVRWGQCSHPVMINVPTYR